MLSLVEVSSAGIWTFFVNKMRFNYLFVSRADEVKRIAAHSRVTSSPQFYLFSSPNRFEGNSSNPIQIAPLNVVQGTRMAQNSNANAPTTIAPKAPTTTARSATISNNGASTVKGKKRDERRRVTHNEVERRRRDKINHWIEKLGQLIPVDGEPIGCVPLERPNIAAADSTASKGGILSKACNYVTALHNKVNT